MLKDTIQRIFDRLIPVQKQTVYRDRHDPSAIAHTLNVDRIHNILREAEGGNTSQLFALYRDLILSDNHAQGEFAKRKLAVLGDTLNIQPVDENDAADVQAADAIRKMISDCDCWQKALVHLLDASLYPVSILEKVFRPVSRGGLRYELDDLVPVNYQLLDYREWDLRIFASDPQSGQRLPVSNAPDPSGYIIHRGHLLTSPDNWGGPMRSILFWWLFGTMDREWWGRFLERFGAPFIVGKYDQTDDASRSVLERAFSSATRLFGVVISKQTEIELQQAATSQTGEAFERFHSICQREKSKLILGQTLSAEAQSTGLGSGVSNTQESVRQDIRQYDSLTLGHTLRTGLFRQYLSINGLPGRAPNCSWGSETYENAESISKVLLALTQAGYDLTDESLAIVSARLGWTVTRRTLAGAATAPFGVLPMSAQPVIARRNRLEDANTQIAREGAATLALSFRGSLAPVRALILQSSSPEDLEARIRTFYADWSPARVTPLIEEALVAYSANGSSN